MKTCKHCGTQMIEYVGFNARAGDPNNPWDCPNEANHGKGEKVEEVKRYAFITYHRDFEVGDRVIFFPINAALEEFNSEMNNSRIKQAALWEALTMTIIKKLKTDNALDALVTGAKKIASFSSNVKP